MGFDPETASPSHLYSQELQLKLYQAFIFSIPILFSIILFLLFYLFYLKKRVSSISSTSANLPQNSNRRGAAAISSSPAVDVDEIFKEKLPVILYDENSKSIETLCCVCLGEFEVKEELHQIPSCKHVFHIDCISHWLLSNATCPLCRCSVVVSTTANDTSPEAIASSRDNLQRPDTAETPNQNPRIVYAEQPQQLTVVVSRVEVCGAENVTNPHQGSSDSGSSAHSFCFENGGHNSHDESVVIRIQD